MLSKQNILLNRDVDVLKTSKLIKAKACIIIDEKSSIFSSPAKKPGLRKALLFEADLFDSSSEGQSSEALGASLLSLGNLVGLVAETSEERYRLLDQRDKIMRQGNYTS